VAEFKTLDGFLSPWRQDRGANWTARWGLLNAHGASEGELAFFINGRLTKPSISVIFRRKLVYRVDIVPASECKSNDFGAMKLGLPARVCGPHSHPWHENREFVRLNGFGSLPMRKPVDISDIKPIRALEVLSTDLNVFVAASQREFELPPQAFLFAEKMSDEV
jgi:hypothetical protein